MWIWLEGCTGGLGAILLVAMVALNRAEDRRRKRLAQVQLPRVLMTNPKLRFLRERGVFEIEQPGELNRVILHVMDSHTARSFAGFGLN